MYQAELRLQVRFLVLPRHKGDQAALSLIPSTNFTPAITSARSSEPFKARHLFEALCINLNTIVSQAKAEPLPLVRYVRNRTVAKTDSIGLVERRCIQCSAGKS